MGLRFLKVSTTTNEKYSVIIRNYTIEIYQNLTNSSIAFSNSSLVIF